MNTPDIPMAGLSIAAVERDTGLAKDTLRVWERRYGFPAPARDGRGERVYPAEQVDKLRLIRRLIDQGMRPARLIDLDPDALTRMLEELGGTPASAASEHGARLESLLELVRLHQPEALRDGLQQLLMKMGLQPFVIDIVAPLCTRIGEAWLRGYVDVPAEHLYTEQVKGILRTAIGVRSTAARGRPAVLLTTFPEEQHALGLLMVEAMLTPEGTCCVSLGVQTPLDDICSAAAAGHYDIVAVSFSSAYPLRHAIDGLRSLRANLPPTVELWAGGAGLRTAGRKLPGIQVFTSLEGIPAAVNEWRKAAGIQP